jgi:hypothetical protein
MKKVNRFARPGLTGWTVVVVALSLVLACSSKDEPPPPTPVEITDISYLKEMDGDVPAHEGETITIEGVATIGTGVMVSGRYVKFHVQDATGGAYVFADTQAQAMVAMQQAGGSSFEDIEIYEGDLVRIRGEISTHEGMIEFHPPSGSAISVLGTGQDLPAPHVFSSVDEIYDDPEPYKYVGDLVRVNGVEIQGDPSEIWPPYGENEKGIPLRTAGDTNTLYTDIYPGSGIPGSNYPEGPFDIVGVLHRGEATYTIYPRALYDINPAAGTPLSGYNLLVYKEGHKDQAISVSVDDLPQCTYDTGREGGPGPESVVTLASFIVPDVVTDPKNWVYKIVASDGRQPFKTLDFNEMKSGLLYEDEYEEQDVLWSYFYEGTGFDDIFFLIDLAEIVLYPVGEGPQEGEATHGEGITLIIDETSYPVNFADLPNPELTERPLADFVPDSIISFYRMSGSFSYDQIRMLYDYRLIPYGDGDECFPVTWDEINPESDPPMVSLSSEAPFANVTGLAGCGQIDDLFTIEMVRKVIVDDGVEEQVFYWEDPALPKVEIEGEEVVFLDNLLDFAGISEAEKFENDYNLIASDGFTTYFPYAHHHLENMYFRPLGNATFVTDENPAMPEYGGRYSVKALLKIELRPIPQEAPSLFVEGLGWLSDPESAATCNGCHVKRGEVVMPVNCAECHTMP